MEELTKFEKLLENRKSVRKFTSKKPSWRDIALAISAATMAPAAGNIFRLKFLVITNVKTIDKIADNCQQDWIKLAKTIVAVCSKDEDIVRSYDERGKKYARQQAGAAIENFILKLEEEGLSTCWVGAFYDEGMKKLLKVPKGAEIEAIFPIGYENKKENTKKKPKPELSSIVYWEKWGNKHMKVPQKQEI
jgi:nitroreductase